MNPRERLVLKTGELLSPGFAARAKVFGAGRAGRLERFNLLLSRARAALPAYDGACASALDGRPGLAALDEISKLPVLGRADVAGYAGGGALARLESGGTSLSGRVETALDLNGVLLRYAGLLSVLGEAGWAMGRRTAALHPVEYGYFNNFGGLLRSGAYGKIVFEFFQQYVLYGLFHNRKNIYYDRGVFQAEDAALDLLRRAAGGEPEFLIARPDVLGAGLAAARRGKLPPFRKLKAVLTVGTALGEEVRAAASEMLGAQVYNMYASTELGYVALGGPGCEGWLHVDEGDHLVETGPGNELIVTDLNNRVTPMLRYATGDVAWLERRRCPCGREGLMLKPRGRKGKFLETAAGGRLYEAEAASLAFASGLPLFQFSAGKNEVRLALNGKPAPGAAAITAALGLPEGRCVLLPGANFEIPASGKFSFII
ncbi:MAG: hypothetical protein A2X35_03295 [Elusimicrobia bacterium GWA2_61_42]|nr:MAG: hypothetical protein A2X35_03295 [Elusimicrobia bacterium GWA2_61_42]OGR77611.1 MAG: hypothetical protein A2X38_09535 [Elusimicrobia bacterium GWC2_61_25]